MNAKRIHKLKTPPPKELKPKEPRPQPKLIRTNTPREKGAYTSYSIRLPKRDMDRIKKFARKEAISVNTFILNLFRNHFNPPVPVEEIDDPSKYRIGMVADGEAIQG